MTTPEGEGINTDTRPDTYPYWYVTGNDGSIPELPFRTQDIITGVLQDYVKTSPNWKGSSQALWEGLGLRPGIPLPAAIIEWFMNAIGLGDVYTSMEEMFNDLSEWAMGIPIIADIVEALTGIVNGDYSDLESWAQTLLDIFSPLNAQNLFNQISSGLLGLIPVSQIGDTNPNLLTNPNFEGAASVQGSGLWFWDATEGHTTPGSTYTTAAGATRQLVSNQIPVTEGQKLNLSVFSKWSGLTYTATPIKVQVLRLQNYTPVGTDDLAAPASPPANQTTWTQLGGNYTVPAGCNMICLQLTVTNTATAGTVRFDDGDTHKTGLMSGNWMTGISGTVASDLQSTVDQVFQAVFGGSSTGNPLNTVKTALSSYGLSNIPDLQSVADQLTNAWIGQIENQFSGTNTTQARQSMDSFFNDFLGLTQKVQDMRSTQTAIDVSGKTVTVNFNDLPDGPLPSSFSVTYSGSGTSAIGVTDGAAGWRTKNNNGNRTAIIAYNVAPTNTDYQIVRGTLSGAPPSDNGGSKPRIAAIGRVDNPANPLNYVWARGYNDGFLTYKGDVGCTIGGVDTVWISNIPLTWSMDISFVIGVGGNPRRYQVFSGTQLVRDFVEPGTASLLGAGYRYWGCKTELKTDSGKVIAPPSIVGTSVSDNAPPNVVGSGAVMTRRSTSTVGMATGAREFPPNFFTQIDAVSPDITATTSNGSYIVSNSGWYLVNVGVQLDGELFEDNNLLLFRNGAAVKAGGVHMNQQTFNSAAFNIYLTAGDRVSAGTYRDSGSTDIMIGDAGGVWTYFSIALTNRSYA